VSELLNKDRCSTDDDIININQYVDSLRILLLGK